MRVAVRRAVFAIACILFFVTAGSADTITLSGSLFSVSLGPSIFNPSLNSAQFGDEFMLQFTVVPSLAGPGVYSMTGASFTDVTASASETAIQSGTLSVSAAGSDLVFSGFACVQSGSCSTGNELDLNFSIPQSLLISSASTMSVFGLKDFELLEDDGATDLIGSLTRYQAIPEPSSALLIVSGIIASFVFVKRHIGPQ
jgi:hypothetical protein